MSERRNLMPPLGLDPKRTFISVVDTAKLVRKTLRMRFPGVKFSVRSSRYAGGASIDVDWDGGPDSPSPSDVELVVATYQGAEFDGMQDMMTYHDQLVVGDDGHVERVHYGADFIFCARRPA